MHEICLTIKHGDFPVAKRTPWPLHSSTTSSFTNGHFNRAANLIRNVRGMFFYFPPSLSLSLSLSFGISFLWQSKTTNGQPAAAVTDGYSGLGGNATSHLKCSYLKLIRRSQRNDSGTSNRYLARKRANPKVTAFGQNSNDLCCKKIRNQGVWAYSNNTGWFSKCSPGNHWNSEEHYKKLGSTICVELLSSQRNKP